MASSSWFSTSNSNIVYQTRVKVNSQSVANNTSNVTVEVWCKRTNTGYTTYGTGKVYCKINGTTYTSSITSSDKITSTAIKLFSKTLTISHNADGSKTLTTEAKIDHSQFDSSYNSYNVTLSTIPRASTISSLTSSVSVNGTNTSSVSISRASSSFTHTVTWSIGSYAKSNTGVATSTSYAIPTSWLNAIPNSTSGTATVTVKTYSGSTLIGTTSKTFTITVPTSVVPTIGSFTITRIDNDVPSAWGVYVQNRSSAQAKVTGVVGAYGSSIKSYSITGGGYSGTTSTLTTGLLKKSGTNAFKVVVTDSRGRKAEATGSIYVEPYKPPQISNATVARCLSSGALNDDGTYIRVVASDVVSSVSGNNVVTREVKYRKFGNTTWISAGNYTSGTVKIIGGGAINVDNSYEVRIELSDQFNTVRTLTNVSTAFTTLDFLAGGKGVAIGKVAETAVLDVGMDAVFRGNVSFTGGYDSGWLDPSYSSGWGTNSTFQFRRVGNVVYTRRYLQADAYVDANTWHDVGTVSPSCSPAYTTYLAISCGANDPVMGMLRISSDNTISVMHFRTTSSNYFRGGVSYHV